MAVIKQKKIFNIDSIRIDWRIYLEGWIFESGSEKNVFQETNLLFKNKEGSYICNTKRKSRPDLLMAFPNEFDVDLCGFQIKSDLRDLPDGEYCIFIKFGDEIIKTEEIIDTKLRWR